MKDAMKVGDIVFIVTDQHEPNLRGKPGRVVDFDESHGTFEVRIDEKDYLFVRSELCRNAWGHIGSPCIFCEQLVRMDSNGNIR